MFNQNKKEISREELYEQVWADALKKVGEMYGVSDSEIRKKCNQFDIPLPDRSYRGRINAGLNPKRNPLPKREGYNFIIFQESSFTANKSEQEKNNADFGYLDEPLKSNVLKIYNTIEVPKENIRNHKLVNVYIEEMADQKRQRKKLEGNLLFHSRKQEGILDIYVTDKVLPRALKIETIILKSLEEIGCKIDVTSGRSIISFRGVQIAFRFKEKNTRVIGEKNKIGYTQNELIPNGKLAFVCGICEGPRSYLTETEIVDTDATKLEEKIKSIFKKIIDLSQVEIDRIARREEQERIAELERIEKNRIKKIRDGEIQKVKSLLQAFLLWEKAENLRSYINALEANLGDDIREDRIESIWWARKKADWIDPLINTDDEILGSVENEEDIMELLIPKEKKSSLNSYW